MGTPYPGYDNFGPWHTYVAGKGRWVIGLAADDGDEDDAARLMALPMGVADCVQWLGHRAIDIVSGSPPGGYSNGPLRFNGNWDFQGFTTFTGGGYVGFYVPTYVVGGATLYIGEPVLGIGHVRVGDGSDITILPGGVAKADGANALIGATNGGVLYADSGALMRVGVAGNGSQGTTELRQYAPHVKGGIHAYTRLRQTDLPTTGTFPTGIDFREADIWVVPSGLPMGRTMIADLSSGDNYEFTVVQNPSASQGFIYSVTAGTFTADFLATGSGNKGSVTFIVRGSSVDVKGFYNGSRPGGPSPDPTPTVTLS